MAGLVLGFVAGVLHVFAGPDHLAAGLAVRTQRPGGAWYYGGVWALGHAAGLTLIGLIYFLIRETGFIGAISMFAERMVGVALILMGAWMLLRRHQPWDSTTDIPEPVRQFEGWKGFRRHPEGKAAIGFGFLHGTAGATHLIGLIPMFALQNPPAVLAYLAAYNLGILIAMSSFCYAVGVFYSSRTVDRVLPATQIRVIVSVLCLAIGAYWLLF